MPRYMPTSRRRPVFASGSAGVTASIRSPRLFIRISVVELFVILQGWLQDLFLYVGICLYLGLDLLIKLFALSLVLSRFDLFKKPLHFPMILSQQFNPFTRLSFINNSLGITVQQPLCQQANRKAACRTRYETDPFTFVQPTPTTPVYAHPLNHSEDGSPHRRGAVGGSNQREGAAIMRR
jgi:hypothetical protein